MAGVKELVGAQEITKHYAAYEGDCIEVIAFLGDVFGHVHTEQQSG